MPYTCGAGGGGYGGASGGGGLGRAALRRSLGAPAGRSSVGKRGTAGGRRRGWARRCELQWRTLVGPICHLGPPAEWQRLRRLVGLGSVVWYEVCTSERNERNKSIISVSVSVTEIFHTEPYYP